MEIPGQYVNYPMNERILAGLDVGDVPIFVDLCSRHLEKSQPLIQAQVDTMRASTFELLFAVPLSTFRTS
jgi:hypothetical protein